MKQLRPHAPNGGEPIPEFTPVPVKYRHDGWTPERQKAFIAALADTGSVTRSAAMVNMSAEGCYHLRRHPQAEGFRRAWEAALDFGVQRLKDVAFERAIEGERLPVFQGGRLIGYRTRHNDRLLMFCLRHYGQDANGRRTTINYFSTRAEAGAGGAVGATGATAQASATTVRTVIRGDGTGRPGEGGGAADGDAAAATIEAFAGVALDDAARAEIAGALAACAARARAAEAAIDAGGSAGVAAQLDAGDGGFVRLPEGESPYHGVLALPDALDAATPFGRDMAHWSRTGAEPPDWGGPLLAATYAAQDAADATAAVGHVATPRPRNNWKKRGAKPAPRKAAEG